MAGAKIIRRVHVTKVSGLWSQIQLKAWLLAPKSINIGYLDPLGKVWLGMAGPSSSLVG